MTAKFLAALLAVSALGGAAQAQSRPMPAYQDDESYGRQTPSDDNADSRDARGDEGYPQGYGDPRHAPQPGRQAPPQDGYAGYDGAPPPPSDYAGEDAAHRADRSRTADLNHNAYARPGYGGGQADYAKQSAQYRAELDDHAHAMQDYRDARARYAERIAHWRARADACEAGHLDACDGPE